MAAAAEAELLRIGNRIALDGEHGTVKYVGPVDKTRPDVIFYGIEWDNPSRGRHSGSHDGVQYFSSRIPGAGSFVRAAPSILRDRGTLADAIEKKYTDKAAATDDSKFTVTTTTASSKKIEMVGFEGIYERQRHLEDLAIAEVQRLSVTEAGALALPNLTLLDVSHTLLDSWKTVSSIVSQLPRLSSLHLNGIRFSDSPSLPTFESIRVLHLNSTLLAWDDLLRVSHAVPLLKELHMANNMLSSLGAPDSKALRHLEYLNLESNLLDWSEVSLLSSLPKLNTLVLTTNKLTGIGAALDGFVSLASLYVNRNAIDSWDSIDALNSFPALTSIRTSANPIVTTADVAGITRDLTIGRVARLTQLNGSDVSADDRIQGERYLLKWLREHPQVPCLRRDELRRIHEGIDGPFEVPAVDLSALGPGALRHRIVNIILSNGQKSYMRGVIVDMTVGDLRAVATRLFSIAYVHLRLSTTDEQLDDNSTTLSQLSLADGATIVVASDQ